MTRRSAAARTPQAARGDEGRRFLVLSPWGLGGGYSGPLTLLDRLGGALAARGATIDVIYRDRGTEITPGWVNEAISAGEFQRFSKTDQLRWGLAVRRILRQRAQDYDAIHLHGFYLANQVAIIGRGNAPTVIAMPVLEGGDLQKSDGQQGLKAMLSRLALRSVDRGMALSTGIADDFASLGKPSSAVRVIGNPANAEAFRVGQSRMTRQDRPVVGFVGKIGGFKNPELVLQAVAKLRRHGHDLSVLMVGPIENERVRTMLDSTIAQSGLRDVVEFTGFSNDVPRLLERMDVFVLPSSREGLPGALCEAMAAGLPCVVTEIGSMGSHVRAANSGSIVAADVDSVASGIEDAISEHWTAWSQNSHTYAVDHFSADAIASTYLNALDTPEELPAHA